MTTTNKEWRIGGTGNAECDEPSCRNISTRYRPREPLDPPSKILLLAYRCFCDAHGEVQVLNDYNK